LKIFPKSPGGFEKWTFLKMSKNEKGLKEPENTLSFRPL